MKTFLKKYFWCLGIVFIVAGLISSLLSPTQSIISIILLILGIILIIGWLIYLSNRANFWQRRSTQTGTNALISTLSVIVIISLLNFLSFRYVFSLDLTETKVFTLSPQTTEIVKNLTQPLKVWLFEDQGYKKDTSLLEEYTKYNDNFQFELVDINKNIAVTQKFKVKNVGDIFIEYNDKRQKIITLNPEMQLTEITLTNAISKILQDQSYLIYFIQGHGEPALTVSDGGMSQAKGTLEGLGYTVNSLVLASENKIPDDCDVLILAGTKRKLLDSEIKLIQEYVNKGGSLFLLVEPEIKTGLEPIFKEWGIELNLNHIIIDPSTEQIVTPIVSFYGDHPITENFNNDISIYDFATPIGTTSVEGIDAIALVTTNEETWAENLETLTENTAVSFDPNTDIPGPLDLGVVLTRLQSETEIIKNNDKKSTEEKPNNDNKTTEEKPNNDNKTTEEKLNNDNKTTEEKLNNDNKTTEEKLNNDSKSTEEKLNNDSKSTEEKLNNDSKSTEEKPNNENESIEEKPKETSPKTEDKTEENTSETTPETQENKPEKMIESRLIIFGDSTFATDGWFENQLNGDVFLNSVKWLINDQENPLSIRPKEFQNRRLNLTPFESTMITLLALVLFPLLSVILAMFTWWKRQ